MNWEDILKDWRRPFINSVISRTKKLIEDLDADKDAWLQKPKSYDDWDEEGNMTSDDWEREKEHLNLRLRIMQSLVNDNEFKSATQQVEELLYDFGVFESGQFPEVAELMIDIKTELADANDLPE